MIRVFLVRPGEPFGRAPARVPDLVAPSPHELVRTACTLGSRERETIRVLADQLGDAEGALDVVVGPGGALYRTFRVDPGVEAGTPPTIGVASTPGPSWRTRHPGASVVTLARSRRAHERIEQALRFIGFDARTESPELQVDEVARRTSLTDLVLFPAELLDGAGGGPRIPIALRASGRAVVVLGNASPEAGPFDGRLDPRLPVARWASVLDGVLSLRAT